MKNYFSILLICLLLAACTNSKKETDKQSKENATIENEEEFIDDGFDMLEEMSRQRRRMLSKSFQFTSTDNCDDFGASEENLGEYGVHKPFNIDKSYTDSNLTVRFTYIDDCCLRFVGDIDVKNDSYKLKFWNISSEVCECYCEYEQEFIIKTNDPKSKKLKINDEEI